MRRIVLRYPPTDPAPLLVAAVAGHVIAAGDFVDWGFAIRAFSDTRVHIVHNDFGVAGDLAGGLVPWVSALPARREAAHAECFPLAAAARPADRVLAAGACAPLERL